MPTLPQLPSYVPSTRVVRAVWIVAALIFVGLCVWLVWAVTSTSQNLEDADRALDSTSQRLDDAQAERRALAEVATANAEAAAALAQQLRELGERPVVDPTDLPEVVPGPQGPQGPQGIQGLQGVPGVRGPAPTAADIQAAVDAYCEESGRCDGKDPTTTQVAAAVSSYCDSRGECRGPAGPAGEAGSAGEDAPPPSQDQVDEAVRAYCDSRGGCRGPQGEPGEQGEPGQDAVPFRFTFTVQLNPVQSQTYTCTITEANQSVTCEES